MENLGAAAPIDGDMSVIVTARVGDFSGFAHVAPGECWLLPTARGDVDGH
jgi:hypothetical protein